MTSDFDYKKYSLGQLETWVSDALLSSEATPQEIYDVIRGAVHEEYHYFKHHTGRCYELLALLGGTNNLQEQVKAHGEFWDKEDKITSCDKDDPSPECKSAWNDFWEENYYPEEYKGSTVSSVMPPWGHSEKAASDQEKEKCREYNLREAEYYNKRAELDAKKDKVKKWILPVEEVRDEDTDKDEYCVTFPDDLLEAANLKEGDLVEWVDQGDGSYLLKKVEERKIATYDEMVADGWSMTADGFWIKEPLKMDEC
jgi:antitoxin component of MazEF toxin-antitoxin module